MPVFHVGALQTGSYFLYVGKLNLPFTYLKMMISVCKFQIYSKIVCVGKFDRLDRFWQQELPLHGSSHLGETLEIIGCLPNYPLSASFGNGGYLYIEFMPWERSENLVCLASCPLSACFRNGGYLYMEFTPWERPENLVCLASCPLSAYLGN